MRDLLDALIADVGGYGDQLGCGSELARLADLVRDGGGAGRRRSVYEIAGIDAVTRDLTRRTSAAAA